MRSFGSDRVRSAGGDQWIILAAKAKGWVGRTPATMTTRTRPGTAVLWENRYYEVVTATSGEGEGGVRYLLEPWHDEDVMRVVDGYDEASEARREADHREITARERGRKTANVFGILTGHLPAPVQERLGHELGILPARLTLYSLLIPLTIIGIVVNEAARRRLAQEGPLPEWLILLAGYLFLESGMRLLVALSQSRPLGSAAGLLAYSMFYLVAPGRRSLVKPVEISRGLALEVAPDVALQDAYILREPILTLLDPAEQAQLANRFGFDYRRHAVKVAAVILLFSVLGVITSVTTLRAGGGLSALLSLVAAGGLAVEQMARLIAFGRGPAGSVLAILVRPMTKKLLQ